jgi:hypothetical protein
VQPEKGYSSAALSTIDGVQMHPLPTALQRSRQEMCMQLQVLVHMLPMLRACTASTLAQHMLGAVTATRCYRCCCLILMLRSDWLM